MGKTKKIFVVSDVHGHYTLLKDALDKAGFEKGNENHVLVCCGDYFDRGSENVDVLKFFEALNRSILLRGNHEDLLLKLLQTGKILPHHYINGTIQTISEFFGKYSIDPTDDTIDFSGKTRVLDRICEFIDETKNYFETKNYVFVHGWVPENTVSALDRAYADDEEWEKARWTKWTEKYNGTRPIEDKTLVCGHVPTLYARKFYVEDNSACGADIFFGNGLIAVDAGTYDTKQINVLVIEDELL